MIVPQKKRQDYEAQAIQPFCDVLSQHGLKWHSGQKADNRIGPPWAPNISYQFGDLRFSESEEGPHLVVEVESAGGVTNLVKYWYCLRKGRIRGKLFLFHVFWQVTQNSYRSHLVVWDLLCAEMEKEFPQRFSARRYSNIPETDAMSLTQAVEDFASLLPARK
jgi:hypothetical protein